MPVAHLKRGQPVSNITIVIYRLIARLTVPCSATNLMRCSDEDESSHTDTDEEIWKAVELSHLKPFVTQELKDGLMHNASEGG